MKLRHIRFPKLTPYATASRIQDIFVSRLLAYKASTSPTTSAAHHQQQHQAPPSPTILTFEFPPTYTAGLRTINRLSDADLAHLRADGKAHFAYTPRGGQLTFHGPGQLVAYPVVDLRRHALSARCYVDALERAAIDTCTALGVRGARITSDVGVWVPTEQDKRSDGSEDEQEQEQEQELRKICAVGVHLRRHVSSHGIGLNVSTDLAWFERIVACGLEGKKTTSLAHQGVEDVGVGDVANVFVQQLVKRLKGVDEVEDVEQTPEEYNDHDTTNQWKR